MLMGVMKLRVEVLGPLRVSGEVEIAIERASHRRLVSILILDANHRIGTDILIHRYWGDAVPATAKAALQTHISALRKLTAPSLIVTEGFGYRLDLEGHELDAREFADLAGRAHQEATAKEWGLALETAYAALALWRGAPYTELDEDDFARSEIAGLEELRLTLLELQAEALLELGRHTEALPNLERLVLEHPLRERLWEFLMTARYRLGRHAEALEAYREAWAKFNEIGVEPSAALRRLEQKILIHDEDLASRARHNLPVELNGFVGRERELDEVGELLRKHRIVTLTGVGGSGKTRLATRVAAQAMPSFPDGCWIAELAPLRDPDLIALEVADALEVQVRGADALGALVAALGRDATLVLLDNCEHLLTGAAEVARALLEAGPEIKVLATSREPLRVPGELVYEVPPMSFPKDDSLPLEELGMYDAIRLFEERARLVRPSFALASGNAAAAARVCRRLDGIPLAIELAAARVGSLDSNTIADRLDDRFRLLTGGSTTGPARHQTLEAALAWSYGLLASREQVLFSRLSVFRGGFTVGMAEDVCSGEGIAGGDVLAMVAALADKSLVSTYEADANPRFRLLETVRAFAWERLGATGNPEATQQRHLDWCVRFAEDVIARVYGPGRWELFERLDLESDNLKAAIEWAAQRPANGDVGVLAAALAWHALDHGQFGRCVAHARVALEQTNDARAEAARRSLLGTALFLAGEGDEAFDQSTQACALALGLDSDSASVPVITTCARLHLLLLDRDPQAAIPLSEAALAVAETTSDPFAMIYARRALGRALIWTGEADSGLEHYQAALDLALETGDRAISLETYESFFVLLYLHPLARRSEPRRVADEMLERFPPDERRWGRHTPADWLPTVFLQTGEWDRAEVAIDRLANRHLEGWDRAGYLIHRGSLCHMQGRLDEARRALEELEELGVDPPWYHNYYPLLADVSADMGRLADVRAAAFEYLSIDVHPSEHAMKLAVLGPLVRAEADAALSTSGPRRDEHVERARTGATKAREILDAFPPLAKGSLQMETPMTHLALAEAELSRATEPDPALWEEAVLSADFLYFRLYSQWRLAEALFKLGKIVEAEARLRAAHTRASQTGADLLRRRLETLAGEAAFELSTASATRRPRERPT
jgi:predicted ATPase/DNA-binding SARP family transcriptional activator